MWRTLSGQPIRHVAKAVTSLLVDDRRVIHIGTDSQQYGICTKYVTVIAVVEPGGGGRILYRRHRTPRTHSLAQKLFKEAEYSLETANLIAPAVAHDIVVHIDANVDARHKSAKYVRSLAGMVIGHGFQVRVKPEAWCATNVADYLVKGKHLASSLSGLRAARTAPNAQNAQRSSPARGT